MFLQFPLSDTAGFQVDFWPGCLLRLGLQGKTAANNGLVQVYRLKVNQTAILLTYTTCKLEMQADPCHRKSRRCRSDSSPRELADGSCLLRLKLLCKMDCWWLASPAANCHAHADRQFLTAEVMSWVPREVIIQCLHIGVVKL